MYLNKTQETLYSIAAFNGSFKYSGQTGARAEFSFFGAGLKWTTARADVLGKANIYFDGVYVGMVDLYSSATKEKKYPAFSEGRGLPVGNHIIAIEVSGQKNTTTGGYYTIIDAFDVIP